MNEGLQELQEIVQNVQNETNTQRNNTSDAETNNFQKVDRLREARTDEQVAQYNSRREIRKSVGKASVYMIYTFAGLAIVIACTYVGCLAFEPFWEPLVKVKENFEVLFFKMFDLLPWLLLFVFGDFKKISETLSRANN